MRRDLIKYGGLIIKHRSQINLGGPLWTEAQICLQESEDPQPHIVPPSILIFFFFQEACRYSVRKVKEFADRSISWYVSISSNSVLVSMRYNKDQLAITPIRDCKT